MAKVNSINLLRSSKNHFWENLLKWALTTGRFLIIVTETIALSAFVYRFTLDRQIIDLSDSIKNKQAIVSLYKDAESTYRNIHERLTLSDTLSAHQNAKTKLLTDLVSAAQGYITYQKLTISEKSVIMELSTNSSSNLSSYLNGLKKLQVISSVSIDRVENKAASGTIVVNITAQLKTGKEKPLPDENI
jgi:hypothetical protein